MPRKKSKKTTTSGLGGNETKSACNVTTPSTSTIFPGSSRTSGAIAKTSVAEDVQAPSPPKMWGSLQKSTNSRQTSLIDMSSIFPAYNDSKLAHILYCQLRILNLFAVKNIIELDIKEFTNYFWEFYHEDFFRFEVLKHFVKDADKESCVSQFILSFCKHFLFHTDRSVICQGNINELSVTIYNDFVNLLEKVTDLRANTVSFPINPTPAEMQLLGRVNGDIGTTGKRHALNFGGGNQSIRGAQPSIKEVGQRVVQIRKRIARNGFLVTVPDVANELCKYYNVSSIKVLNIKNSKGLFISRETDIPEMLDLVRLQSKVNAFIQSFVTFRNIATLYELGRDLCKMESKQSFEEFNLGPLAKQLLVYEYFKFPYDKDIPFITTMDVFRSLQKFMNVNRKSGSKFELTDFLEYFIKDSNYQTPFETGVKMLSMPLAIQCVGKAISFSKRDEIDTIESFKDELLLEMERYLKQVARKLFRPEDYRQGNQDNSLISQMKREDLVSGFRRMVDTIENVKSRNTYLEKNSKETLFKSCNQIKQLLRMIAKCELSTRMLHLVLCTCIWRALNKDDICILLEMGFKDAASEIIEKEAKQHQLAARKVSEFPKSEIKKLVKTCMQRRNTVEFTELSNMENWVVNRVNKEEIKLFEDLGHGSFLKFVSTDKELLSLVMSVLEINGGKGFGSSSHGISKEEIKDFLKQCYEKSKNKEEIKRLLRLQFNLIEMSPALQQVFDQTIAEEENGGRIPTNTYSSPFTFSTSLVCESDVQFITSKDTSDKRFYHLACQQIRNMPFLVDIGEHTNWNGIYYWKLGPLKSALKQMKKEKCFEEVLFIRCQGKDTFVKVHKSRSTDDFNMAVKTFNSSKAMDAFVSVVVSSGHLKDSPLALMASYVKNAFLYYAKDKDVNNEDVLTSPLLRFTLECFTLLPFDLLVTVAEKLFLTNLEEVYGAKNVPSLLLGLAEMEGQRILSIINALGHQLAVQEWITSHEKETEKPFFEQEQDLGENLNNNIVEENVKSKDVVEEEDLALTEGKEEESEEVVIDDNETDSAKEALYKEEGKDQIVIYDEDATTADSTSTTNLNIENDIKMDEDSSNNIKDESKSEEEEEEAEKPVDEKTARLNYCHVLIEEIREKQFGIGVELSEKGKAMINTYREREGRSLDRLSKELYTKDSHFVLELIQNADDNDYHQENLNGDSEEKPTVAFIVEKDKVTVLNNEKGFMEKNIRALCDVGKSTKGIHRKGYIGQKGIGFKSVFRVTGAPNIHSNGFHIKFDASRGPNGYILPEWLENANEFELESISQNNDLYSWRTQIVLPLKEEMQLEKLTSRFHDIDPSLLMFLNRLQTIVVDDRVTGKVKTMSKRIVGPNLVELCENGQRSLWFVVSKEVPISIRPDVSETSISVAFPISFEKQIPQKVFAFLPLRSYGFKYIIQADFEVPSSREDIDKDSPWNQFILNKIPSLVLEAFACFKNHSHFKGLDGVITFFKFMEHQDHILGIFKRVQVEIMRKLQQEECLPVLANQDYMVNDEIEWALPSTVVVSKYDNKSTITPAMLKRSLNLKYIHPELKAKKIASDVLSGLGVSNLSLDQLIEVLKIQVNESGQNPDVLFPWIGNWMSVVATILQDECDFSEDTRAKLRSLKMLPVTDCVSLVSLDQKVVFLPVADTFLKKNKGNTSLSLEIIEKDLCIVSRLLSNNSDELESELIRRFLKELGVKSMTASDLINDYIIPSFKNGSWKEKSEDTIVAYVHYLCEQYHKNPNLYDVTDLASCIVLRTNKGLEKPAETFIYMTPLYGNQLDLERDFGACQWTLISDVYLKFGASKKSTSILPSRKWKEFFDLLGLKYFTTLRKEKKTLHKSDLPSSPWKQQFETWPPTEDDNYVIHDLICPEFERLLESGNQNQLQAFGMALDSHWGKYFAEKDISRPTCKMTSTDDKKLKLVYSSFFLQLRFSPWILLASDSTMSPPFGLYMKLKNITAILSDKSSYIQLPLNDTDFIQVLGLKTSLQFQDFLKEFRKWRSQSEFETSLNHMLHVYEYLRGEFVRFPIEKEELLRNSFVFLPDLVLNRVAHHVDPGSTPHKGRFYRIDEVCWEDPSCLIAKEAVSSRRMLKDFYVTQNTSLRDFFLSELCIERYPQPFEYIALVSRIAEKTTLPDNTNLSKILRLYQVLGSIFIIPEMKDFLYNWRESRSEDTLKFYQSMGQYLMPQTPDNIERACKQYEKFLPSHHNRFVGIKDRHPILVFDDNMASKYKKEESVDFIFFSDVKRVLEKSRSENKHQYFLQGIDDKLLKIMFFFKACKLPTLTDLYVPPEINPEQIESGCYLWQSKLHEVAPYVQRYLAYKESNHYKRMQANNFADYLRNTTFFSAYRFEVVSRLKSRRDVNVTEIKLAHVEHSFNDIKKATIYFIKEHAESSEHEDDILREVVRLFVPNNDLKLIDDLFDFICSLFIESNKDVFMSRRKKIPMLGHDVVVWEYPKPPEPFVEVIEEESEDREMEDVSQTPTQDGERPMTCWPPRKPGGSGHLPKPDYLKKQENEILEKWQMPEAPISEKVPNVKHAEHVKMQSPHLSGTASSIDGPCKSTSAGTGNNPHTPLSADDTIKKAKPEGPRNISSEDQHHIKFRDASQPPSTEDRKDSSHQHQHQGQLSKPVTINESDQTPTTSQEKPIIVQENQETPHQKDEKPQTQLETYNDESKRRAGSLQEIPGTHPRGIQTLSSSTPNGTPSKFNVGQLPVFTLSSEYKNIPYQLNSEFQERILSSAYRPGGDTDMDVLSAIGQLGEEIVFHYFCTLYEKQMQKGYVEVVWINQKEETGEPYDFIIKLYDDAIIDEAGHKSKNLTSTVYIEVKTTSVNEEKRFEISSQQLRFALEQGSNFHLYRVSGLVAQCEFRLRCLENLASHMDKKAVKVYMVL